MNEDLFPGTFSLSPKREWLLKHGLVTQHIPEGGSECPESGDIIPNWVCRVDKDDGTHWKESEIGGGGTEEDAICDYCKNSGTPHYSLMP